MTDASYSLYHTLHSLRLFLKTKKKHQMYLHHQDIKSFYQNLFSFFSETNYMNDLSDIFVNSKPVNLVCNTLLNYRKLMEIWLHIRKANKSMEALIGQLI